MPSSTGTCVNGTSNIRTVSARSGWFEITATTSAGSSPRRQRQRTSSRQWSWRETRIASRCRVSLEENRQSISNRPPTSRRNASSSSASVGSSGSVNSIRMKKVPSSGSVECCAESVMFAPRSKRNVETAATIPGRSGQTTRRRSTGMRRVLQPDRSPRSGPAEPATADGRPRPPTAAIGPWTAPPSGVGRSGRSATRRRSPWTGAAARSIRAGRPRRGRLDGCPLRTPSVACRGVGPSSDARTRVGTSSADPFDPLAGVYKKRPRELVVPMHRRRTRARKRSGDARSRFSCTSLREATRARILCTRIECVPVSRFASFAGEIPLTVAGRVLHSVAVGQGIRAEMTVGQWSGKHGLPVDRSSDPAPSRTLTESWSCAEERDDRTRFVPVSAPVVQGVASTWSSAVTGEDRARSITVVASTPRVAESWSNARKREDRTSAAVDIRDRESATESWSFPSDREDRTRVGGAVSSSSLTWTARAGVGGVAISAVTIALVVSAPAAFADTQPTGTTTAALTSQAAPTDGTTSSSQANAGTPANQQAGPSSSTSSGADASPSDPGGGASADPGGGGSSNTQVTDQTSGNPGTTGTSASATGPPGSTTSTDGSSNPTSSDNPPSSNHQDTKSDATANQSGASNSNVSAQVGQGGDTGSVKQGNQASSEASSTATGSIPQSGSDPSATATAATKQDSPTNSNVNVLVGTSGNVGSVSQQNNAQADASAAGTTTADGTGGGGVANASATQTSPGNLNVTVRVGSPGDNGPVEQQNTVGASAGPDLPANTTGTAPSTDTPATTDQSVTTSNAGSDVT